MKAVAALLLAAGLVGCQSSGDEPATEDEPASAPSVVEVTMADYAFVAPDTIPSGWTTFQVTNRGEEHHNFHLHRLPDGRTAEDFRAAFVSPADSLMQLHYAGKINLTEMGKAYERIVPDWADAPNMAKRGGMGYLAPELSSRNTVRMEPGTYVMHCAIRAPDGQVHAVLGMRHFFTVTEEKNGAAPPTADLTARISGQEFLFDDTLSAGTHTVKFEVEEVAAEVDSAYWAAIGRLGPDISADSVARWPYRNPAPTTFLGGIEYIDARRTPYVTVDLSPGRYVWVWGFREDEMHLHEEFVVR